jgi:hypothetical protein
MDTAKRFWHVHRDVLSRKGYNEISRRKVPHCAVTLKCRLQSATIVKCSMRPSSTAAPASASRKAARSSLSVLLSYPEITHSRELRTFLRIAGPAH